MVCFGFKVGLTLTFNVLIDFYKAPFNVRWYKYNLP